MCQDFKQSQHLENFIKGTTPRFDTGTLTFQYFFMNDMFLFMKNCNFYNYADDNFVSRSSTDVNVILSNLKNDCQISLKWFDDNGMKAYPSKFKFKVMSSEYIEPQELMISYDVCLRSQTDIKVLGVTIDHRLTFNEHIRICTLKAARQLNALPRVSRYLDIKSKSILYNSFDASNFNYCPLVWHFGEPSGLGACSSTCFYHIHSPRYFDHKLKPQPCVNDIYPLP